MDGSSATITKTNVWARNLTNGALAVVFINVGTVSALVPVSCNKACFDAMGVRSAANFSARDLWTHTDNGGSWDNSNGGAERGSDVYTDARVSEKRENDLLAARLRRHMRPAHAFMTSYAFLPTMPLTLLD